MIVHKDCRKFHYQETYDFCCGGDLHIDLLHIEQYLRKWLSCVQPWQQTHRQQNQSRNAKHHDPVLSFNYSQWLFLQMLLLASYSIPALSKQPHYLLQLHVLVSWINIESVGDWKFCTLQSHHSFPTNNQNSHWPWVFQFCTQAAITPVMGTGDTMLDTENYSIGSSKCQVAIDHLLIGQMGFLVLTFFRTCFQSMEYA